MATVRERGEEGHQSVPHRDLTVAVLCDSSRSEFRVTHETILPALRHWGTAHRTVDLAADRDAGAWLAAGVFFIAQEGLGPSLRPFVPALLRAIHCGAGMINLDHSLAAYGDTFTRAMGVEIEKGEMSVSAIEDHRSGHAIKVDRLSAGRLELRKPLPAVRGRADGAELLHDAGGHPLVQGLEVGSGRVVQFLISPKLWSADYFGLARGLDGVLWRSIAWVTPGSLVMLAMPPFVRHRFDDCHGHWRTAHDIAFFEDFAAHGQALTICPCLGSPGPEAAQRLSVLAEKPTVELAPHTVAPSRAIFASDETDQLGALRQAFATMDEVGRRWGVTWSKVVSDHDHEWDSAAIPLLRDRGMRFRMNIALPDERWSGIHKNWYPEPFGALEYALSPLPGDLNDFFVAFNHFPSFSAARTHLRDEEFLYHRNGGFGEQMWDFLNGLVDETGLLGGEEPIIQRLVDHTRVGLDSLFFGGSISHSHFTRYMPKRAWDPIIAQAMSRLAPFTPVAATHEELAEYAVARRGVQITSTRRTPAGVECRLVGGSTRPLVLSVWNEIDGHLSRAAVDIPPFAGECAITARC